MKHGLKLFIFVCLCLCQQSAIGQGVYTWTDTLRITTTPASVTPSVRWEYVEIWSDSVEWMARQGASSTGIDTTSWSSRDPIRWMAGERMRVGPGIKLRKLEYWAVTGSGWLYFWGYKTSAQY